MGTLHPSVSCQFSQESLDAASGTLYLSPRDQADGIRGPKLVSWNGGTGFACVRAPFRRTGGTNSGGTSGLCDGSFSIDWNAFVAANPSTLGAPFIGGETVWAQCWFRDPGAPGTTSFSDALRFLVFP